MITKSKIEEFVDTYLEDSTFEDLLEEFNLTPFEVFEILFDEGMIDEDLLDRLFS